MIVAQTFSLRTLLHKLKVCATAQSCLAVRIRTITKKMEMFIPDSLLKTLQEIGEIGGSDAYLVGGSVRDLILKRDTHDIDIVVEGDAISVAESVKTHWHGEILVHQQFGTATVTSANPTYPKIDFVTARCETYQQPATLPKVEKGTLTDDLLRRDFSINALAMCINSDDFGNVIDITGGIEDLKSGTIRVLHEDSYFDDPTRIFRAFRYAGRYSFRISETDSDLIRDAGPLISELSGERIRNELDRILLEDNATEIIRLLSEFGIFEVIFKDWRITPDLIDGLKTAEDAIKWSSEHLKDDNLLKKNIRWMAFFGLDESGCLATYHIEAVCYRLVLDHQLHRIAGNLQETKFGEESVTILKGGFEKVGYGLGDRTTFDFINGKWCLVDSDSKRTYIYDEGVIFRVQTPLATYSGLKNTLNEIVEGTRDSEIYRLLREFPLETLALGFSDGNLSEFHRECISDFLLRQRKIQPIITGDDLIQWGEKPGREFEKILRYLFAAQLDGRISCKQDAFTIFQEYKQ